LEYSTSTHHHLSIGSSKNSKKKMKEVASLTSMDIISDLAKINVANVPKLITKEDGNYFHFHKILGVLSLLHYGYRVRNLILTGSMKFDGSLFTLACIGLHTVLSGSSFIFHISNTRIRGAPMIYPEFRLHSIIFAYRSLLVMLLQWICLRYDVVFPLYLRGGVVILTMVLADMVTRAHKDQGTTMRAMPFPEYASTLVRDNLNLFYSVSQIFATGQVIFGVHMDEVFAVVFPIQIAALLMTCVRKSIISAAAWHNFYALSLLSNYVVSPIVGYMTPVLDYKGGGFFFPCTAAVIALRFGPLGLDKYVIWTVVAVLHLYAIVYLGKYDVVLT
jgi:hypothetical protein